MPLLKDIDIKVVMFIIGIIISMIITIVGFIKTKNKRRNEEIDSKEAVKIMRKYYYATCATVIIFGFPYFSDTFFK